MDGMTVETDPFEQPGIETTLHQSLLLWGGLCGVAGAGCLNFLQNKPMPEAVTTWGRLAKSATEAQLRLSRMGTHEPWGFAPPIGNE
jgi:hypothetical protein